MVGLGSKADFPVLDKSSGDALDPNFPDEPGYRLQIWGQQSRDAIAQADG